MSIHPIYEGQRDNTKVTPDQLLQMVQKEIDDVRGADQEVTAMHVVVVRCPKGSQFATEVFRCGLPWEREIAILTLTLTQRINNQIED